MFVILLLTLLASFFFGLSLFFKTFSSVIKACTNASVRTAEIGFIASSILISVYLTFQLGVKISTGEVWVKILCILGIIGLLGFGFLIFRFLVPAIFNLINRFFCFIMGFFARLFSEIGSAFEKVFRKLMKKIYMRGGNVSWQE